MANVKIPLASRVVSPLERQIIYTGTGFFAGACTVPVSALLARSSSVPFWNPTFRSGARFWIFDIARRNLPPTLPIPLAGGLSGAAGGAGEVLLHSLAAHRALPSFNTLASHSGKLFIGFGTFTGLSKYLDQEIPPKPLPFCWLLGALAGALATGLGRLVDSKGKECLRQFGRTTVAGAAVVATSISVQVTSSAEVIKWVEGRGS